MKQQRLKFKLLALILHGGADSAKQACHRKAMAGRLRKPYDRNHHVSRLRCGSIL